MTKVPHTKICCFLSLIFADLFWDGLVDEAMQGIDWQTPVVDFGLFLIKRATSRLCLMFQVSILSHTRFLQHLPQYGWVVFLFVQTLVCGLFCSSTTHTFDLFSSPSAP